MAYQFNGTTQYLSAASLASFAEPFTLACWFYPDSLTQFGTLCGVQNLSNGHRALLLAENTGLTVPGQTLLQITANGGVGANVTARSTTSYVANQWQHACGVFTSTSSRTAYLDGGGSATNTTSYSPTFGTPTVSTGARNNGTSWGLYHDGGVADAAVWNAALTAAEVASLAKGMTCNLVRPQSLVFYAPLIRDLQDVRRGLTITNNNTATVADHPRVYQ